MDILTENKKFYLIDFLEELKLVLLALLGGFLLSLAVVSLGLYIITRLGHNSESCLILSSWA